MILGRISSEQTVTMDVSNMNKWDVITHLVDLLVQTGKVSDRAAVLAAVMEREKQGSTGLEQGIAVPHARTEAVSELVMALAISKQGVDFESADGKPCYLMFLVVAPPRESARYLDALAAIACMSRHIQCVSALVSTSSREEAFDLLINMNGAASYTKEGRKPGDPAR